MQAASSAKRTCSESRSTSLRTATVLIPISLQVQMMRQAISPRLAIRIFLNLRGLKAINLPQKSTSSTKRMLVLLVPFYHLTFDTEQRLAVLYRLPVFNINLDDFSARLGLNLVHEFHGFDDADDRLRLDTRPNLHKRLRTRRWRSIKRTDDRRSDHVQVLIVRGRSFCVSTGMRRRRPRRGGTGRRRRVIGNEHRRRRRNRDILTVIARQRKTFTTQTHAKVFALEFEFGQPVFPQQRDQLAQLVHVDGGFRRGFVLFFACSHSSQLATDYSD